MTKRLNVLQEVEEMKKAESKKKRTKCEVCSRAVGYLRPVEQWHSGKQAEFKDRKTYDKQCSDNPTDLGK